MRLILRITAALLLLAGAGAAHAQCGGYFEGTYNTTGYYDTGYYEDTCAEIPDVVGLSTSAADTALELAGFDTGLTFARCSSATLNEVVDQIPPAGTTESPGFLVNLNYSSGVPCEGARRRMRLNLEVKQ